MDTRRWGGKRIAVEDVSAYISKRGGLTRHKGRGGILRPAGACVLWNGGMVRCKGGGRNKKHASLASLRVRSGGVAGKRWGWTGGQVD